MSEQSAHQANGSPPAVVAPQEQPAQAHDAALEVGGAASVSRVVEADISGPAALPDVGLTQYEPLAARLLYQGESGPLVLAVTSSVAGEGVTTVCTGVALALATSTTKRVLLVDANLRRPGLHELLNVPLQPGLHELVQGNRITALKTAMPNLWVVSGGAPMDNPAQLMTSEAARTQIAALRERFDFVVIDCPPVLSAVDAASICRLADAVIIVVRAGLTPRDVVRQARQYLQGAPVIGAVLNGV